VGKIGCQREGAQKLSQPKPAAEVLVAGAHLAPRIAQASRKEKTIIDPQIRVPDALGANCRVGAVDLGRGFVVGDELTPTMKIKRKRIAEKCGAEIEALYGEKKDRLTLR
jgi:long-subunit acyl-CoA synthetase (AMP-forming)